ncbi:MAG: hypothetical protein IJJ04_01815 [Clostridia bacterium]|nr:hypothetical protein [Clostridia bacterium]
MKTEKNNCVCGNGCTASGIILGIIFGVIIAVLFSLGFTPLIFTGIWIAFSIAGASLIYLLVALSSANRQNTPRLWHCLREKFSCLIFGTIGTILTSIAALSIALEVAVIALIVLIGALAFFFMFLIVALVSLLKCLVAE